MHKKMACSSTTNKQDFNKRQRNQIVLVLGLCECKVPLTHLRLYLILINLLVFLSALASLSAGRDAASIRENYLFEEREATNEPFSDELISLVHNYMENILYFTTFSLSLHWIIFGVVISSRFDGTYEKLSLSIWISHSLAMVVWEVGLAVLLQQMVEVVPSHHYMATFYTKWNSTLATLFIAVIPAQLVTVFLPLLSYATSEDKVLPMDGTKIWHTEMPQKTRPFPVASLYHTEMPEQKLKKSKPVHIRRAGKAVHVEKKHLPYVLRNHQPNVQKNPIPYVQSDYVDMLGTSPPPSYHSLDKLDEFMI